jgi:hypothetical protein
MRRSYGSDPDRFALLQLPAGDGPHPVAVLVHGGFWRDRCALDPGARSGYSTGMSCTSAPALPPAGASSRATQ